MKKVILVVFAMVLLMCCDSQKNFAKAKNSIAKVSDTVRIANDSLEYEVIIIDPGFNVWLASNARPRQYFSKEYLENRNRIWVQEWNNRVLMPTQYGSNLYQMTIDYESNIDYGYEVNYLIYNYLTYFQISNRQQFGVFMPRI